LEVIGNLVGEYKFLKFCKSNS